MSDVQHVKSALTPEVLYFTGRADLLRSIEAIELTYRFAYDRWHLPPPYINWESHSAMMRTLAQLPLEGGNG